MAKKKIQGSLAGLIEEKPELAQLVSGIPLAMAKEFNALISAEGISMSKGVTLAISLFNARLRGIPALKATDKSRHKIVDQLVKEVIDGRGYDDGKVDFIGRVPSDQFEEFHDIRKKQKLKVYEASAIAASLLIKYYKDHKKKTG